MTNDRTPKAVLLLAEAAIELAIQNRNYRQVYGDVSLPNLPDPEDVKVARAQLVKLRAAMERGEDLRTGEVLEQIALSLQRLRS